MRRMASEDEEDDPKGWLVRLWTKIEHEACHARNRDSRIEQSAKRWWATTRLSNRPKSMIIKPRSITIISHSLSHDFCIRENMVMVS